MGTPTAAVREPPHWDEYALCIATGLHSLSASLRPAPTAEPRSAAQAGKPRHRSAPSRDPPFGEFVTSHSVGHRASMSVRVVGSLDPCWWIFRSCMSIAMRSTRLASSGPMYPQR